MRVRAAAALLLAAAGLGGCAALPALPTLLGGLGGGAEGKALLGTSVGLSRANYRVVRSGVRGESSGLTLLLFLTIIPTSYADAFADLQAKAPFEADRAQALANVVYERSARNFLLFALPKVRVRADVVEFLDDPAGPPCPAAGSEPAGPLPPEPDDDEGPP
jgi:hypothetical protein